MVLWLRVSVCWLEGRVECKGYNDIPDTPRGESHPLCVGEGDKSMFCDYTGAWVEQEGTCCRIPPRLSRSLSCGERMGEDARRLGGFARLRKQPRVPLLQRGRHVGSDGLLAVQVSRDGSLPRDELRRDEQRQPLRQRRGGVAQVFERGRLGGALLRGPVQ